QASGARSSDFAGLWYLKSTPPRSGAIDMSPLESADALKDYLRGRRMDFEHAALEDVVPAVLDFYETVRAGRLDPGPQSAMLLFQYGVYDWGKGAFFELDITRQFIEQNDEFVEDGIMSQLACTMFYKPTPILSALGRSHWWCHNRSELSEFSQTIQRSLG